MHIYPVVHTRGHKPSFWAELWYLGIVISPLMLWTANKYPVGGLICKINNKWAQSSHTLSYGSGDWQIVRLLTLDPSGGTVSLSDPALRPRLPSRLGYVEKTHNCTVRTIQRRNCFQNRRTAPNYRSVSHDQLEGLNTRIVETARGELDVSQSETFALEVTPVWIIIPAPSHCSGHILEEWLQSCRAKGKNPHIYSY